MNEAFLDSFASLQVHVEKLHSSFSSFWEKEKVEELVVVVQCNIVLDNLVSTSVAYKMDYKCS